MLHEYTQLVTGRHKPGYFLRVRAVYFRDVTDYAADRLEPLVVAVHDIRRERRSHVRQHGQPFQKRHGIELQVCRPVCGRAWLAHRVYSAYPFRHGHGIAPVAPD